MLDFGRVACSDLRFSGEREWLVTNGIGGYASGTVSGVLTSRYHGLLIAALQPPVGRTLLVTKFDELAVYAGETFSLFADRWVGGRVEPGGYEHLERFRLEGTVPVWTFCCGDAQLEKRLWMQPGANRTYIRYELLRGSASMALSVKAVVNYRDHHGNTHLDTQPIPLRAEAVAHGLRIFGLDKGVPYYILSDRAMPAVRHEWYQGYFLTVEEGRGLDPVDDNLCAGLLEVTLEPGGSVTFVATTDAETNLDSVTAYAARKAYESALLEQAEQTLPDAPAPIRQLVLAADQFVVRRELPGDPDGRSVIAGYPWFSDWGRDTMITLPGLTLATGRPEVAERILRTFGFYADRGMLPNRFPDEGQAPEYNTVDATLWYFEAIRAYHAATGDTNLVRDLFPILRDIVDWHVRGTRYQIQVDPADGLVYAGEPGVQLTWMDAKVDDWVVTPRIGKPVEVNALWYNALCVMAEFARLLGEPPEGCEAQADKARAGFARFWNKEAGYCYDVVDGPDGNDPALRPNQLFAVSLPHSPLTPEQQKSVVDACARHLLTSHGLRSLAPGHPEYHGRFSGDRRTRDGAYHQGTVWGWLIGPFASAHLKVYHDPALAPSFLWPLIHELDAHCVGSLSEVFDGDPPHRPGGCIAQAWSMAEVLRVWKETSVK
jgi:predicted glycogen debranching enzyme